MSSTCSSNIFLEAPCCRHLPRRWVPAAAADHLGGICSIRHVVAVKPSAMSSMLRRSGRALQRVVAQLATLLVIAFHVSTEPSPIRS